MTGPVITINGRVLIEPQVKALCGALKLADGQIDAVYDADRLTEILQLLEGTPSERAQQEKMLAGMHADRVNRILQLAGIVPEQASGLARSLAEGYARAGVMNDEAAVRLRRAMGVS